MIEKLYEYLKNEVILSATAGLQGVRASSLGDCLMANFYRMFPEEFKPEPMSPRRYLNLQYGKEYHEFIVGFYLKHYPNNFSFNEEEIEFDFNGFKVKGHIDGFWYDEEGYAVVEIKTMSNVAFSRALRGEIDRKYLYQLYFYSKVLNVERAKFVLYRKETSHLVELELNKKSEGITLLTPDGTINKPIDENDINEDEFEMAIIRVRWNDTIWNDIERRINILKGAKVSDYPVNLPLLAEFLQGNTCSRCEGKGYYETEKLKKVKTCPVCNGTGQLEVKELKFPCSYCSFVKYCYKNLMKEKNKLYIIKNKTREEQWAQPLSSSSSSLQLF
jgi:hypothetical protein